MVVIFRSKKKLYVTGPINDQVGPKRGRTEDWAYSGSQIKQYYRDRSVNKVYGPYRPTTYGGYDISKTKYDDSMLRALKFLIDISRSKSPPRDYLGNDKNLFNHASTGNGHIP